MQTITSIQHASHARPLKKRLTIGVLETKLDYSFHTQQWAGVVDVAQEHDVNVICFAGHSANQLDEFREQGDMALTLAAPDQLDGLIVWSAALIGSVGITRTTLANLCQSYRPLPVVSTEIAFDGVPSILMDDYQGMCAALVHLIEVHSYRRIAFIRGPEAHFGAQERYRAYCETLAAYQIPFDPKLVTPPISDWVNSYEECNAHIHLLLDERHVTFEAIVGPGAIIAPAAITALRAKGFHVPGDIAVVGFDDSEEMQTATPPITTVRPPFYDMGRQAATTLLALIEGENAPTTLTLPMQLVLRRSCGCEDPAVLQAAAGVILSADQSFETAFAARREAVLTEMALAVGTTEQCAEWLTLLLDAFATEMTGTSGGLFLSTFDKVLDQAVEAEQDVTVWHEALSRLRRQALPCLSETQKGRAEDLWQQVRTVIGQTIQRLHAAQALQAAQQTQLLREIGAKLISAFDLTELMDVLVAGLQQLHIPGCYLALYDHSQSETPRRYEYPQPAPEWSRLMLAYHEERRIPLESEGQRFLSRQFIPQEVWSQGRAVSLVVRSLYFRENHLGFVVFEAGLRDGQVYEALRGEISSALQGALLMQRVQAHARELAAAYEEIRILNHQLQEENLRMSAELDVSRRIQQMVLPSAEELRHIEGLEIVGYMKPANEVGGDYYDVLDEHGTIHIGIGDVTGHGLESGVVMLMTQTAIRTLVEHGETDPVAFLTTLNRVILKNAQRMHADKTLTLAFIQYDHGTLKLIGQHEELLVVHRGGSVERVDTLNLGFPLGLEDDISAFVAEATLTLQRGDSVVLYTDGITEAANPADELYGLERLCAILGQHWEQSAEAIKQAVIDDVMQFIGSQVVYDDVTLVVLKQS